MVTVVTMFPGAAAVSKTPSPSSRPSREPMRIFVPTMQSADCTVDRHRKAPRFFLCLGQRSVSQNRLLSRLRFAKWRATCKPRQRLPQKPQVYPLPKGSPRHFAAGTDESVIVGYYTLEKCVPRRLSAYIQT